MQIRIAADDDDVNYPKRSMRELKYSNCKWRHIGIQILRGFVSNLDYPQCKEGMSYMSIAYTMNMYDDLHSVSIPMIGSLGLPERTSLQD